MSRATFYKWYPQNKLLNYTLRKFWYLIFCYIKYLIIGHSIWVRWQCVYYCYINRKTIFYVFCRWNKTKTITPLPNTSRQFKPFTSRSKFYISFSRKQYNTVGKLVSMRNGNFFNYSADHKAKSFLLYFYTWHKQNREGLTDPLICIQIDSVAY